MKSYYVLCLVIFLMSCSDDKNLNTSNSSNECAVEISADEFFVTVPDYIVGEYSLSYTEINPSDPFSEGDVVDFNISTNDELLVQFNGDCINLKNPILFAQGTTEANFKYNSVFNAMFGVSEYQSRELSKINIATLGFEFMVNLKTNR